MKIETLKDLRNNKEEIKNKVNSVLTPVEHFLYLLDCSQSVKMIVLWPLSPFNKRHQKLMEESERIFTNYVERIKNELGVKMIEQKNSENEQK